MDIIINLVYVFFFAGADDTFVFFFGGADNGEKSCFRGAGPRCFFPSSSTVQYDFSPFFKADPIFAFALSLFFFCSSVNSGDTAPP